MIFVFHIIFSSVTALALASITGVLTPAVAWCSLITGTILAIILRSKYIPPPAMKTRPVERVLGWVLMAVIVFVGWKHFMWMFYSVDHTWSTLVRYNQGDLPLHLEYIRAFAGKIQFFPANTSYAAEPLRYPFGVDLYSALWESVGAPTRAHLFLMGFALTLILASMLKRWGGWFLLGAFFLAGGAVSFWSFDPNWAAVQEHLAWKNLFLTVWVTQRGVLVAIPVGIWLLSTWPNARQAKVWAFCLGIMPFFHLHSFVVLILLLSLRLALNPERRQIFKILLRPVVLMTFPLSLAWILHSTAWLSKSGVVHLKWLWTKTSEQSGFMYLAENFGVWFLILLAAFIFIGFKIYKKKLVASERQEFFYALGALGIFVLFLFVILAPWDWDNIKLLIWPYLVLCAYLGREILPRWPQPLLPLVAWLMLGTGTYTVLASSRDPALQSVRLFSNADVAAAEEAIFETDINATFAAAPTHDHILKFFGRKRVVGFPGHLWSHGISASESVQKTERLLRGDPQWLELAHELGVNYIFWGPQEREKYPESSRPWRYRLHNLSPVAEIEIYQVSQ